MRLRLFLLLGMVSVSAPALAATNYLPLNLAPELETRVERLLILAGVPVMTRPIPIATVQSAMATACRANRTLCGRVRRDLAPWLEAAALTGAGASGASTSGSANSHGVPLVQPDQHGAPMNASWQAFATGYARFGPSVLVNLGIVGYAGRTTPTGTIVSVGGDRAQLDLGYRDHWWSPLRDSSMLLSTEAPTLPSATLSNSLPLTRAHINYEIFAARMSHSARIVYNNAETSGYPRLFGFHLSIEPAPGWSLAVSRLMQFGGGPRPSSLRDLVRTFFKATKYDNTSPTLNSNQEFGNEQFAVSSEFVVPGKMPMSLYMELAAEDSFHAESYRFGNSAVSAGIYLPRLRPSLQLRYEFSNWQNAWYVHHIYLDGLTNFSHVLGNWAGDWRQTGDGVGGQSHMLDLTWESQRGTTMDARYRTMQNASYSTVQYRRAHDLTLSVSRPWRQLQVGASLEGGRDVFGERFGRAAGFIRFGGDGDASGARDDLGSAADSDDAEAARNAHLDRKIERFIDVGLKTGRLKYEYDVGRVAPVSNTMGSAHLALGVRRAFNSHSDFGTRLELDNVRGRPLMALRAIDYRYRLTPNFAPGLFFGVARYAGPTPAIGWYGGVGLQWRNVLPRWDIAVDINFGDKLQRDKLAPGESAGIWPDAYYVLTSKTIYISRRF